MATAARVLRLPVAAGDGMGLTQIDYPLLLVLALHLTGIRGVVAMVAI